jgi:RimJ/RimL family protein N-acetyltransferase
MPQSSADVVPFVVRVATEQDGERYHAFLLDILSEQCETLLSRSIAPSLEQSRQFLLAHLGGPSVLFFAESGGAVIGTLDLTQGHRVETAHGATLGMCVRQGFRGEGVGRSMLQHAINWARRAAIERIDLDVISNNAIGIQLYESQGFVREGIKRRGVKRGSSYLDLIQYALPL